MTLTSGQILNNRYRIVKLLAVGGFGTVYRAWDLNINSACAVKENLENSPDAERQFMREANLLAQMRHTNLPRVTDHFTIPGQGQYLVMDFIEGEDLETMRQQQGGALLETQVLPWIEQVCDALNYLHSQNPPVIHRDIKPANIRITPQGKAMLVDFGIAKQSVKGGPTTTGAKAISPGYSPPEQYTGTGTDERSDVYALGATIYTLLTGVELPESIHRMIGQSITQPPHLRRTGVTPRISQAIMQAIHPIPTQRFASIKDFQTVLFRPVLVQTEGSGIVTPLPKPQPPAPPPSRPKIPQWAWGILGGAVMVLLALLIIPNMPYSTPTVVAPAAISSGTTTNSVSALKSPPQTATQLPTVKVNKTMLPYRTVTPSSIPTATTAPTSTTAPRTTTTQLLIAGSWEGTNVELTGSKRTFKMSLEIIPIDTKKFTGEIKLFNGVTLFQTNSLVEGTIDGTNFRFKDNEGRFFWGIIQGDTLTGYVSWDCYECVYWGTIKLSK